MASNSTILSSMLFLLLLVFSLHMDEAFGGQSEIRKLKVTIKLRRNLEGDDHRSSKIDTSPSRSRKCGSGKTFKNMATTYGPDHDQFSPLPRGNSSSLCIRCVIIKRCVGVAGTPLTCTEISRRCENIPGH